MKLYHYTSIENLALILKNKTIRFTRLDKVDDSEEAGLSCKNIQLSYYTFVSCWTDSEEESIPLWKMYAGKEMHGIRISLDSDMFLKYHIPSGRFYGVDVYSKNEKSSILPIEKIVTKDYLVVPSFNDSEMFFKKILYVDNPFSEMRDVVQIQDMGNGEGAMKMNLKKIGLYKRKCWAFQKEHRFTLTILPNIWGDIDINQMPKRIMQAVYDRIPPKLSFFDLEINPELLSKMKITLSPICSEAEKVIVESIVQKFAPKAIIRESMLKGLINR